MKFFTIAAVALGTMTTTSEAVQINSSTSPWLRALVLETKKRNDAIAAAAAEAAAAEQANVC